MKIGVEHYDIYCLVFLEMKVQRFIWIEKGIQKKPFKGTDEKRTFLLGVGDASKTHWVVFNCHAQSRHKWILDMANLSPWISMGLIGI